MSVPLIERKVQLISTFWESFMFIVKAWANFNFEEVVNHVYL